MNHYNNLTALRWFSAGLVLFGHSFTLLGLPEPVFMNYTRLGPLGVSIFFAVSGYLVTQSWERDPHLYRFLVRRALRIFPGLAVCLAVTTFVLGPLLSTLRFTDYFTHSQPFRYFFENLFLYITFSLPEVFTTNIYPHAVNGSIWSLPVEFFMYLIVALIGVTKLPRFFWLIIVALLMYFSASWSTVSVDPIIIYRSDLRAVVTCGVYFWIGSALCRYKFNPSSVTTLGVTMIAWISMTRWPEVFAIGAGLAIPILALGFGLATSNWLGKLSKYDYSYGIYIYAFPVQQTIAHFFPKMSILPYLLVVSTITLVLAAVSWHLIEKKALALKPKR
ncbi:acyltransferase family protein [Undibacterium rugosum]|uniref:acyltransferase family protein n=1 Tax=Undibacterium rugosum TaxID=2762291 RepID=UPI001B831945|nr:acyltransferase [Undibacterium rugosum]MBR7779677.1 acyltransferase [Undibacterium rugosum]